MDPRGGQVPQRIAGDGKALAMIYSILCIRVPSVITDLFLALPNDTRNNFSLDHITTVSQLEIEERRVFLEHANERNELQISRARCRKKLV